MLNPAITRCQQQCLPRYAWFWLLCLLVPLTSGCGYPRVSPEAFELAKAVDNLCNLRDATQLPRAREIIIERHEAGDISNQELGWLSTILDQAEAGNWEAAMQSSRKLLLSQNSR